jgi:IclR family mhp operon transcriptional activator
MSDQVDGVRSVRRALQLMRILQALGSASLADIQRQTGLAKATLLRQLRTLEDEGVIWQAQGDARWRPAYELHPSRILLPWQQQLIDVAMPILDTLRREVVWPSDLAVREGPEMRLLETTRRSSGLAVNRDDIGHRVDVLSSAVGRAYIAGCSDAERAALLDELSEACVKSADELQHEFDRICTEVRHQGYARRGDDFRPQKNGVYVDDNLAAIAAPVHVARGVIACVNVVWLRRVGSFKSIAQRSAAPLRNAAAAIANAWKERGLDSLG